MGYAEGITEMGDLVDSFVAQTRTSTRTDSQGDNECDEYTLETKCHEILNSVQNYKFDIERRQERLREERERLRRDADQQSSLLGQSKARAEEAAVMAESAQRDLQAQEQLLSQAKAKVEQQLEDIPKLTQMKQLHYSISRITLDKSANKNRLKGFVVNPRKDDVNTFDFNYSDPGVSKQFVTNYLWDVIAAGVKPVWDNM